MGRRPLGVTILGVLILIAALILALIGIAGILVGLAGLIPGSGINPEALLVGGLISLIIAIVLGIAGSGLLSLRPWAWWLATIVTLAALIYTGYGVWQAANRPGQGNTVDVTSLLALAFLGVIFVYLLTVYRRFRSPVGTA